MLGSATPVTVRLMASEAAEATGGRLVGPDVGFDSTWIDSRQVVPGSLFVPIVAERDGHDYIEGARERGASAHLVQEGHPTAASFDAPTDRNRSEGSRSGTAVMVDDTAKALVALGRLARSRLPEPVVGVTGSVGKTSTKDLIAAATGQAKRTHANPASFNNELGLPLTLLNAPANTEVTVLEMGARGRGHISELCQIGLPTIGIVTRVALAHGEQFGSIEGVAEAKGELIEHLPAHGRAVLNAGDERVLAMAERSAAPVLTYGIGVGDVSVLNLSVGDDLRPMFELVTPSGSSQVHLRAKGAHMAENAAAAVAVALTVGVDLTAAVAGVENAMLSAGRMDVGRHSSGAVIINDAYNANPTSVRAALAALAAVDASRRIVILGVMAELGDDSDVLHRQIADEALAMGCRVLAVDAAAYGSEVEHAADKAAVLDRLGPLEPGDAVLVKGSLVAGLQELAESLVATD